MPSVVGSAPLARAGPINSSRGGRSRANEAATTTTTRCRSTPIDRRTAIGLTVLLSSGVSSRPLLAEDVVVPVAQDPAEESAPPRVIVEEIVDEVEPAPAPQAAQEQRVPGILDNKESEEDLTILLATSEIDALNEKDAKTLKLNRQIKSQNRAPKDFPDFVRRGYDMLVFADGYEQLDNGLIVKEFEAGDPQGRKGKDGDEVTFHYTGYNEEGGFIDSSFKQKRPAQIRLGIGGMIPGFELAVRDMVPGSRRRVIVPPALGPPVGPATFFSAKQYEVFDIQLLGIKSCVRQGFGIVSTVKCE